MKANLDFPPSVRAEIIARAGGMCEVCKEYPGDHVHHRLRRAKGGPGVLWNGLFVCSAPWTNNCHWTRIHNDVANAVAEGWLIRSSRYLCLDHGPHSAPTCDECIDEPADLPQGDAPTAPEWREPAHYFYEHQGEHE